jgi:hypothetical protein
MRISFKLPKYIGSYCLITVAATVTLGVSHPSPNRNLVLRFERSSGSNRNNEQSHISSLWQDKVRMARTKEFLAFPCCFFFRVVAHNHTFPHNGKTKSGWRERRTSFPSCFFFRVVAPLYLEEPDCMTRSF